MPSSSTLDAFVSDEFVAGLVFGFAAFAIGVLIVYVWRQWRQSPVPVVGSLLAVAAAAGLLLTAEPPSTLWVGAGLLAAAGAMDPWAQRVPLLAVVLAGPGAWWVAQVTELPGPVWVPWAVFAWIAVGGPLLASFDRHTAHAGYGPVLLAISVGGMFTTLPDTELVLVLFGAAVALAFLAIPYGAASLGAFGTYPLVGVIGWVIAVDGRGRESAVIGAMACLGLLAVEPMVRWWRRQTLLDAIPIAWWRPPVVAVIQVGLVLIAARVAGLMTDPQPAALIAAVTLLGAGVVLAMGGAERRPAGVRGGRRPVRE